MRPFRRARRLHERADRVHGGGRRVPRALQLRAAQDGASQEASPARAPQKGEVEGQADEIRGEAEKVRGQAEEVAVERPFATRLRLAAGPFACRRARGLTGRGASPIDLSSRANPGRTRAMPQRLDSQSADFAARFSALLDVKREAAADVEASVRAIIADEA